MRAFSAARFIFKYGGEEKEEDQEEVYGGSEDFFVWESSRELDAKPGVLGHAQSEL
jgi:hypothetical protein